MAPAARKWLKRIALAAAALVFVLALSIAWLAYRVTRVPAWYTAAVDVPAEQTSESAQGQVIGFRNWLARVSAGNPDQLPEAMRRYTLTLSADQINGLLKKWTDNFHYDVHTFRVSLGEDEFTLQGQWDPQGRIVGLTMKSGVGPAATSGGRPSVWVDSLRVGEQPVPLKWANSKAIEKISGFMAELKQSDRAIEIDEHGTTKPLMFEANFAATALAMAQGYAVQPVMFLSPNLTADHVVPLNIVALKSDSRSMTVTFQLLTPPEQQALIEHTEAILAAKP